MQPQLDLDPLSIHLNFSLGDRYYRAREYDLAITQLQKTLTLAQDYTAAKKWLGLCFLQKKLYTQAIDVFSKLTIPGRDLLLSYAYALAGDKARSKAELEKNLREDGNPDPYYLAMVYIALGNFNEALAQLERGYERRIIEMVGLKISPEYDPIRNEPRFKALLKKVNLD